MVQIKKPQKMIKKISLLSIVLILTTMTAFTQRSLMWQETWVTGNSNYIIDMITDSNNNVYATGVTNNGTNNDVFLSKHDNCGALIWHKTFDSGWDDDVVGMGVDNLGFIYIAGNHGAATKSPLIIKYDSSGNQIWAKQIIITQGTTIKAMTNDKFGNVYITGSIPTSTKGKDTYLAKYDSAGNFIWSKFYDAGGTAGSNNEEINDISLSGNSVLLTGYSKSGNILTLKYSNTGILNWVVSYVSNYIDYGVKVRADILGNVYVSAKDIVTSSLIHNGSFRIIKYNSSGVELWNNYNYNISGINSTPNDMIIDSTGNVYVTGETDDGTSNGNIDMVTIKYSTTGTTLFTKYFTSPTAPNNTIFSDDKGEYIRFDNTGNIVVFGIVLAGTNNNLKNGYVIYSPSGALLDSYYVPTSDGKHTEGVAISSNNDIFMGLVGPGVYDKSIVRLHQTPSGFQAHNYSIANICQGDSLQLMGYVPNGSTFSWSPTINMSDSTSINPWVYPTLPTFYTLTIDGCNGQSNVHVIVNQLPASYIMLNGNYIFNNTVINKCVGDSIKFNGIYYYQGYEYDWQDLNNSSFFPITVNSQSTPNITQSGIYSAYVINQTTGCHITTPEITLNFSSPTVVANSTFSNICMGDSIILFGSGAINYTWSNGVTDSLSFSPTVTTTYVVTGTDSAACTDTAQITVTVDTIPSVLANSTSSVICNGDAVTLTGSGATNYTWNNGVTDGLSFSPNITNTYIVT